jgi:hypothetical protein
VTVQAGESFVGYRLALLNEEMRQRGATVPVARQSLYHWEFDGQYGTCSPFFGLVTISISASSFSIFYSGAPVKVGDDSRTPFYHTTDTQPDTQIGRAELAYIPVGSRVTLYADRVLLRIERAPK